MVRRTGSLGLALLVAVATTIAVVPFTAFAGNTPALSPQQTCARAADLEAAGETDAARKLYVALLSKQAAPCASAGLARLNRKSASTRFTSFVTTLFKDIAAAVGLVLLALLVLALIFVGATRWKPTRRLLPHIVLIGRLFEPSLKVEPFTDAGAKPQVGEGVTGLARTALSRLGHQQNQDAQIRIDNTSGVEQIGAAISGLGDVAPQAKGVLALLTAIPSLASTPRYSLAGTLQLAGVAGDGMTVSLKDCGSLAETTTFWWLSSSGSDNPDAYYQLASAAAGWADFLIRKREALERTPFTRNAVSFGYFHAAVELEAAGRTAAAHNAYRDALAEDPRNVGALLNLGQLYGREGDYNRALNLLFLALVTAEADIP